MTVDAIVIPGGGLRRDGTLPPWVENRLDRALATATGREFIVPLSAATIYKPAVLDAAGLPVFESVAAARYLMQRGFDAARVLPETTSYDTIGNAYFCRVIHAAPLRLRNLLVITSEFHMERTEAVFRWVFGAAGPEPLYSLAFQATPDIGMPPGALAARYEKERAGMAAVRALAAKYQSLSDVHRFVYTEHAIYAPARWAHARHEVSRDVAATY